MIPNSSEVSSYLTSTIIQESRKGLWRLSSKASHSSFLNALNDMFNPGFILIFTAIVQMAKTQTNKKQVVYQSGNPP
jgi:hypothetical protein